MAIRVPSPVAPEVAAQIEGQHMSTGKVIGEQLTAFAAGDNEAARKTALELAEAIGFDPIDACQLKNARSLESLAPLDIQLSRVLGSRAKNWPCGCL